MPVSSISGLFCSRGSFQSSPKFTGFPCHAPLPWSRTPVARPSLAFYRDARTGPRRVKSEDNPQGETFEAQSHGFSARCQRFVPASRLTTHDSLPAAWLQALPRGVLTRWAALQGFDVLTLIFCLSDVLLVCVYLGAMTPFPVENEGGFYRVPVNRSWKPGRGQPSLS